MGNCSCSKHSAISKLWDRDFLIFIMRTIAASTWYCLSWKTLLFVAWFSSTLHARHTRHTKREHQRMLKWTGLPLPTTPHMYVHMQVRKYCTNIHGYTIETHYCTECMLRNTVTPAVGAWTTSKGHKALTVSFSCTWLILILNNLCLNSLFSMNLSVRSTSLPYECINISTANTYITTGLDHFLFPQTKPTLHQRSLQLHGGVH